MPLTPLPPAPSILDPENFSEEADAFVAALGTFVTELNAIIGLTIPAGSAAAGTLTGGTLAANVLASSLTSLGTIASLVATAISGGVVATQADQETATSAAKVVTPSAQQSHPSAAKCTLHCNAAGAIQTSFNVTSIADDGTGQVTVTVGTDFSSANYPVNGTAKAAGGVRSVIVIANTAGAFTAQCLNSTDAVVDPTNWMFSGFGDQ